MIKENNQVDCLSVSMDDLMPVFEESFAAGGSVKFSPKGVSMLPMIRQGIDTVTLSPIKTALKKYDIPLYRRDDGKYVLHRIVKAGETYTCIGDNQFVVETGLRRDRMIAVVTAFTRGDREYTVESTTYRIYCRLWHYSRFPRRVVRSLKYRIKRIFAKRRSQSR